MLSNRAWTAGTALLVLMALMMGVTRMASVPLDSHEIFVAGTAETMSARGDWILPWFNGEPRLNKPPLSYWAAGGVATLAGDLPHVEAWHVRLVSVFGGLVVLSCTLGLGVLLFDRGTALIAGALLVGSAGLFSFMHDGRPDMLYAAWCSLMLLGFANCTRTHPATARNQRSWCLLAWVACAGAILTKGPQIPLFIVLGLALHLWLGRGAGWALPSSLRPVWGVLLVLLLCMPWWWALSDRLSTLAVEKSQLGGSLLVPSLAHLGEFYYAWRPLQLLLPWLPLVVLALMELWRNAHARERLGFLSMPLLVCAVMLSFGRQYRYFYLLPLLGPMTLLIARPVGLCLAREGRWTLTTRLLLGAQCLLLLACAAWVVMARGDEGVWIGLVLVIGLGLAVLAFRLFAANPGVRTLGAAAVLMASIWTAAALTGRLWNEERYAAHALARKAAEVVPGDTPLATLGVSPTLYAYYTDCVVPALQTEAEVATMLGTGQGARLALVIPASRLQQLQRQYRVDTIEGYRKRDNGELLVMVQPGPSS